MNELARAVYQARKDGHEISANIRLKKNGQFSSVSGVVEDLKVSQDGFSYAVVKKSKNKYQSVRLENILSLTKDDWVYSK